METIETFTTFTTFLLFTVMFVMALTIIVLVIWVARLASRLRKFSDSVFSAKGMEGWRPTTSTPAQPARQTSPMVSGPIVYQSSPAVSGQQPPIQIQPQQSPAVSGQIIAQSPATSGQMAPQPHQTRTQPQAQTPAISGRIATKGAMKRAYQSPALIETAAQENAASDFFDRYKQHESPNQPGFGRKKPSIPFGEDKTVTRKRDTYADTAADLDIDPDSIDFSRVIGYRDIYTQ